MRTPALPPVELATRVGAPDLSAFENPSGDPVFPGRDCSATLDIGCGCGRVARRLMLQREPPLCYLGVDIDPSMIAWCSGNLAGPGWEFKHMDIHNGGLNPRGKLKRAPIPGASDAFTLAVAWSLFTHVVEEELEYSLSEAARCLRPGGELLSTWFLFDKDEFPFMQSFQNALYINLADPINAVVYDKAYLGRLMNKVGLVLRAATMPACRGFQWILRAEKSTKGENAPFPKDTSPVKSAKKEN